METYSELVPDHYSLLLTSTIYSQLHNKIDNILSSGEGRQGSSDVTALRTIETSILQKITELRLGLERELTVD